MSRSVGYLVLSLILTFAAAENAAAASVINPPALPPPTGTVVTVSTVAQLQSAVAAIQSNTTIVLAPGQYMLTGALYINGSFSNLTIRGATNNRDDVVLAGRGAGNSSVPYGIWVGGNVRGITIANLTIRDVYNHGINFNAGTQTPRVYNVRLADTGQQQLKANPDGSGGGVNNGVVEYSVLEYSTTSPSGYSNAVDVHTGAGWIVRNNLFRNMRAPQGQLAGPAILMWNASRDSVVEGNTFIDCQREIALGLEEIALHDHTGGIVRNNFIVRSSSVYGDAAIGVFDSPGTQVLHNTVLISGTYQSAIEYRFAGSRNLIISANLVDAAISARDGATATVSGNVTSATSAMFVDPANGDLHLRVTAATAIDRIAINGNAATDWDGQARPYGSSADVGADEFRPSAAVPTAPTNLRIVP
jgi:hypothetical protein